MPIEQQRSEGIPGTILTKRTKIITETLKINNFHMLFFSLAYEYSKMNRGIKIESL